MLVNNDKSEIEICGRKIGNAHKPFIIAEIGINHEGNINKAIKMVKDAHASGAECVKFQCHIIEDEMIPEAKNIIPGNATEPIYDIMKRCTLTEDETVELKNLVESLGMIYLSTPFSRSAANLLEQINVCAYKIGSGECNNYPLIHHIASFGKPILLSTGMNDIKSISKSVKILEEANVDYALLHCTSIYPTPYDKVRLGALKIMQENFPGIIIGLSDHSIGNYTSFASIPLGASIIEKHFTSDKNWVGPDIPISITPKELKDLLKGCNAIHLSLGGTKNILSEEKPTIDFAYACVVSTKNIKFGDRFNKNNIWVKRPGTGEIKAIHYNDILGKQVKTDIKKDMHIKWNMIKDD